MSDYKVNLRELSPLPSQRDQVEEALLGDGGFGKVYRAKYQMVPVAVKIINEKALSKGAREQLQHECDVMGKLHHPHIGRLYGYTLEEKNACIVLELAELGSVYDILRNTDKYPQISWKKRLSIASDIAKGVYVLHSQIPVIIHRDLKSLNALLRKTWSAFIVDFGLSKVKLDSQSVGTKQIGSFPWMAPEMYDQEIITTSAVDIYAFGMILFELLTRQIPWQGLSQMQVLLAVMKGQRPKVPEEKSCPSVKDCPVGYVELMQECWSQDPKARPPMSKIVPRLERLQDGLVPDLDTLTLQTQSQPKSPTEEKKLLKAKFVHDLLSPFDLADDYSELFLQEGYDSLHAVKRITVDDLKALKVKTGHQSLIMEAITATVGSNSGSTSPSSSQLPAKAVVQSSLFTVEAPASSSSSSSSAAPTFTPNLKLRYEPVPVQCFPTPTYPDGVCFYKQQLLFVSQAHANSFLSLTLEGKTLKGKYPTLKGPTSMDCDANALYVLDTTSVSIFALPSLQLITFWRLPVTYERTAMSLKVDGNIVYLAIGDAHAIFFCDKNTGSVEKKVGSSPGGGPGQFNCPLAVTSDPTALYICDFHNNRVQVLEKTSGTYLRQWGSKGVKGGQFSCLRSISHHEGILYVGDNCSIQLFSTMGVVLQRLGGVDTGKREGEFYFVYGSVVAGNKLFVSDTQNRRIQVFRSK